MAIELQINPNTLTRLDIKKTLRLGQRIFSYETLGTRLYAQYGASKYRKLRKNEDLNSEEERIFKWKVFRSAFFFLMAVGIAVIHIVIDLGLEFDTAPDQTLKSELYDMAQIRPDVPGEDTDDNERLIGYLRVLRTLEEGVESDSEIDCEGEMAECQQEYELRSEFFTAQAREQINFARTTFASSGLKQLDVVQEVVADYEFRLRPGVESHEGENVLCDSEVRSMQSDDFTGTLELEDESQRELCLRGDVNIISLTFDLRASRAAETNLFKSQLGERSAATAGLDEIEYVSWRDSKDEKQNRTSYVVEGSIRRLETNRDQKTVSITSIPGIRYADNTNQTVSFINLTRAARGGDNDARTGMERMFSEDQQGTEDYNCAFSNTAGADEDVAISIAGTVCGTFRVNFYFSVCKKEGEFQLGDEKYTNGTQRARGVITIPGWEDGSSTPAENSCREALLERYEGFLPPQEKIESSLFVAAIQADIVCVTDVNENRKRCIAGEKPISYDPFLKAFVSGCDLSNDGAFCFEPASTVGWEMMTISDGSGRKTHKQAMSEIGKLLMTSYAQYERFAKFGWLSRDRLLGLSLPRPMPFVIGAMSSQLIDARRLLFVQDENEVAVLTNTYIYGVLGLLVALTLVGMYTLSVFIAEFVAYKRLHLKLRIPSTATEWIAVTLGQVSDPQHRDAATLFVKRRNDPDVDGLQNEPQSTTTGPILPGGDGAATLPGGNSEATLPGGNSEATLPGGNSEATLPGGNSEAALPGGNSEATLPGGNSAPEK